MVKLWTHRDRPFAQRDVSGFTLRKRARTDRAQLAKAIAALTTGDTLVVTKLDRLARCTRDLLNTLAAIGDRGATFRGLGDAWANSDTPHGRLMVTVLGGLAQFERYLILARTDEGRTRAKLRGIRFGRRPKLTPHQTSGSFSPKGKGRDVGGYRAEL